MDKAKYLSRIDLFQGMTMEELKRLEPVTPMNIIKKGSVIASPHMDQKLLYLVKSGTVRLYKLTEDGKELTLDVLGAGHLFGEIGSFTTGSDNTYAETLEDSVICTIDNEQFKDLIRERPVMALKFIEIVSSRLREVQEMLEHLAYGSVRKRLLFLLYKLSQKFGVRSPIAEGGKGDAVWLDLNVKLTHEELASMLGSIRETVTHLINEFAAEGIVKKSGSRRSLSIQPESLKTALQASK
ncbi:Crp/Fnr family transcriptional regulator [Paenibacillus sedimenti]|uniref:Crp/Fnr family transcriptional regulator n=1 Tax=Paenibacillus sedimenti TaxID=2770274 RepID=A0A926KQQ5_9BACL|nr:Crp/Fnr family transcriptional regulator [Paenibacillus sedimenti]MBD0382200.1 Crp/Fnr family transcriptional regulator [Paenibacillus sedimenti]